MIILTPIAVAAARICAADPTLPTCLQMEKDLPTAIWIMWSLVPITAIVCAVIKYSERIARKGDRHEV